MPKKVLLVDDSATTRMLHRAMVARRTNYSVICAQDGKEAVRVAASEKPDLILMDVMMPGMSGLEVCRHLRQQKSSVPIVFLTFRTAEDSMREGFESGCSAYLKKPVEEKELLQTLHRFLGEVGR